MREEAVFALADGNAEPVAGADGGLDLEQQLAADREEASANAADAARPVLRNFVELERRIINECLNGGDDIILGIADSDAATNRTHFRFREAGGQFADCVWMEDAVGVDRDD